MIKQWTDKDMLEFARIASGGSYGDYKGCKSLQSKLKRYELMNKTKKENMSRSDEQIKDLLKACRDEKSLDDIVSRNKVLVDYTGEELDDMEDIPGWEYIMSAVEKVYEQYEDIIEDGSIDWNVLEYGPNRFMVWGSVADFIEGMIENEEINASYE